MSQPVQRLRGHAGGVLLLAYKHDNKTLATCGFDGTVMLRGPVTGKVRATLGDHQGRASAVRYSLNAITLVTETTEILRVRDSRGALQFTREAHRNTITAVWFSADGEQLFITGGI